MKDVKLGRKRKAASTSMQSLGMPKLKLSSNGHNYFQQVLHVLWTVQHPSFPIQHFRGKYCRSAGQDALFKIYRVVQALGLPLILT